MAHRNAVVARWLVLAALSAIGLSALVLAVTRLERSPQSQATSGLISPTYIPTGFYSAALTRPNTATSTSAADLRGVVVNHHLLATSFIVDTLRKVDPKSVDRILLLAPNHFSAGTGFFITTRSSFDTPFGRVRTDAEWLAPLIRDHYLIVDDQPFIAEHGVYGLLPIVVQMFPGVPIVPVITKVNTPLTATATLAEALNAHLDDRTLVIASLDFAHDTTDAVAQTRDAASLSVLQALDVDTGHLNEPGQIAVDSPPTLSIFLRLMTAQGAKNFTLVDHSNSAQETGQLDATNVTSHITGTYRRSLSEPAVVH